MNDWPDPVGGLAGHGGRAPDDLFAQDDGPDPTLGWCGGNATAEHIRLQALVRTGPERAIA